MVDCLKLKALMIENGLTQKDVSKSLNISQRTLSRKLKDGKFNSIEMNQLVENLHIEDPAKIFFA